jgi:hypothetical protein
MGEEKKLYKILVGKPEGKTWNTKAQMGSEWIFGRLIAGCGEDSFGSGYGPVVGCCECGHDPSGSGTTEFVSNYSCDLTSNIHR